MEAGSSAPAGPAPGPPPSIPPSGDQGVWADVSPLIAAACADLQDGELVHGENFSLFAAMSALEIMDPKMDSGIERSGYYSIDEAIEDGIAPVPLSLDRTLDIQRTLDVIDHLFSCEATWHKGHTLAQTVFTCIYLMKMERISSHAVLNSFCRILRATCNSVISVVSTARTHEEEDLFTMSFGLPLNGEGDDKCLSVLNSVEETISRQLRACKSQALSKKKTLEEFESLQDNPELEEGYCRALLCRLRFRKHFHHVVMCMRKPQGRGLDLARKHVTSCLAELSLMLKSQEFLKSRSDITSQKGDESCTTASGCCPIGFDVSLNSRLLSPAPPRAVQILAWSDAIRYFEKLLHDLDIICALSLDPVLENVLHFIAQFQKSVPDLVPRAFLQTLLVQDGKLYGRDLFCDVISRALSLPDIIGDKEFQSNEFVVQLGQLVINLLKILCTNTAWQRRKLGKSLQDWSTISIQLELALKREFGETRNVLADENMCMRVSKQLLVWSQEHTYWIASRFLILGFELDLYSPSEYCMVYWYMHVVFIKLIEKMQLRILASNENSRRKGKKKKDHSKDSVRDTPFPPSCLLLQCYVLLSEGLSMLLAALRKESKSFQSPSIFNTEQERFMQHFDLLQKAQIPECITYYSFKEAAAQAYMADVMKYNFFKEIQKIIPSLKGSFASEPEKLAELRQIEQVAEHNRIALNIINHVGASDPKLRVSFEFTHHPHFAVAVVKRS
ncbi:N-alpha-acetyltransferase 35, NatC auxiliary subunit isoform X1 [Triticum urartu]|uniref:N-alpha-acetyltransferase 35, NatC auxiliary subunit n=2 Tax=Triticum urartu TaxID=4572 RepID=A0A8R7VD46_TRIUA|nr:N-alpha-acetyltransferase 35, NatC auxiliary subunit isoform X1 [Triticum urartu]